MSEPKLRLLVGDTYRCERALAEREEALRASDPAIERHVAFGDEIDPSGLKTELRSSSLFALGRHFVLRRPEKAKSPKAIAAAIQGEIPPETFVTFVACELKATNPIYKRCKAIDALVSLPTPRGRGIAAAAREILAAHGVEASPSAVQRLVFRNGGDLLGIAQEAAKLRTFAPGERLSEDAVDRLVFPSAEKTVFPFFDRLGERNVSGALATLQEMRDDPGRTLGGAVRHLTRLTMVRLTLDRKGPRKRLSEAVGLPDWLCKRLADQAKRHTLDDLKGLLELGVGLDVGVKSGRISAGDALLKLVLAVAKA